MLNVLSTRAWLVGLENAGVIESAADGIEQIGRHVRLLSTPRTDVPADIDDHRRECLTGAA